MSNDHEVTTEAPLPYFFAKKYKLLVDPNQPQLLSYADKVTAPLLAEAQRITRRMLKPHRIDESTFQRTLKLIYEKRSGDSRQLIDEIADHTDLSTLVDSVADSSDLLEQEDSAPIIRLINALLAEAVKSQASDIHIETYEHHLNVRFRVDGQLRDIISPKKELSGLLVSRIKVMAKLDIAEKRIPQDGRISLNIGGHEVDIRVSTMPSSRGERVVMRLLDKEAGRLSLTKLGMREEEKQRLDQLLRRPHGIILVTGPTGSGKTTTLYAGLSSIDRNNKNILTIEDPIEYNLEGIGQTQVNTKTDMTFARGLRAILRQDPDVVMVGEIRDVETAQIAIQASLTGHLVLSTLHTNSALGAITRLVDMGIEPFLLSSSLIGVIAQRLVRLLCPQCKQPYQASESECDALHTASPTTLYRPTGCDVCNHHGYLGRTGIYEIVPIDDRLRAKIHDRAGEPELAALAREKYLSMRGDGILRVLAGDTTLEEVLLATYED